jgi:hypothetical protein
VSSVEWLLDLQQKDLYIDAPAVAISGVLQELVGYWQACTEARQALDRERYLAYIRSLDKQFSNQGLDVCLLVKKCVDANPGIDGQMKEGPLRRKCKGAFDAAEMSEVSRWLVSGQSEADARKRVETLDWAWDTKIPSGPHRADDVGSALRTPISDAGTMSFTGQTPSFGSSWMGTGTERKGDEAGETRLMGMTLSTFLP